MEANRNNHLAPTWITKAGFSLLTVNSVLALYRSWGDPVSVLFRCLRDYERAPRGSPASERARRAVWPLTTLLTMAFAWKVAGVMPSAVAAAVVWALAVATTAGGFFALFIVPG
ncbi:unnamed protein product [Urochloa humidicola]